MDEIVITMNLMAAFLTLMYIAKLLGEAVGEWEIPQHYAYIKRSLLNQHIVRRRV